MPLDIMTLKEWKTIGSAGTFAIRATHTHLTKIDASLTTYHAVQKHNIEGRIRALSQLMGVIEQYGEVKRGANPQLTVKQNKKITASQALYVQADAKREYLASVMGVERNMKGMFGVGNAKRVQDPGPGRFKALAEMVYGAVKYTGGPSQGRMLHESYWTEAIDPLHRNWGGNSFNSPVLKKWAKLRYEDQTTNLSFYRWFETLTDQELSQLTGGQELNATQYQDEAGREQFRVYIDGDTLKQPNDEGDLVPFSTENYDTNFSGKGWSIFVISTDGKLYANNHRNIEGWFHSAFMGGKPILAAGEQYIRNGKLYGMTPKSGHYQPQATDMINGLNKLSELGLDLSPTQIMAYALKNGERLNAKGGGILCEWYDAEQYRSSAGVNGLLRTEGIANAYRYVWNPQTNQPQAINGDEWTNKQKFKGWIHPT